jgi:hypothetical protein
MEASRANLPFELHLRASVARRQHLRVRLDWLPRLHHFVRFYHAGVTSEEVCPLPLVALHIRNLDRKLDECAFVEGKSLTQVETALGSRFEIQSTRRVPKDLRKRQ